VVPSSYSVTTPLPQTVCHNMVSSTVQVAQSATTQFQFNAAVDEFIPSADLIFNPHAKEFKFEQALAVKSKGFNREAKEFVPPSAMPKKPTAPMRPPPGLEKSLGLSVHAKEFMPPPAPAPVWQCAVNLDDYTDDESEDEVEDKVDINQWRGLCGRLSSPYIWSEDKEELMDEPDLSDSEADTAEPSSSRDSESESCSGCESP